MMKLVFASNNEHKLREIVSLLPASITVLSLKNAGVQRELEEPFDTLEKNAEAKARAIYESTGLDCFSEDTGLEVDVLDGQPGVYSARYAGPGASTEDNIEKLMAELRHKENRIASFRTVMHLIIQGKNYCFEGRCPGKISRERKGGEGFGYDPVFIPDGTTKSFAEMRMDEKNLFSHRKKALMGLVNFLNDNTVKKEY